MAKPKKAKVNWLDRDLIRGPYLTLCLSQAEFEAAAADCGLNPSQVGEYLLGAHARTHVMRNTKGDLVCIVCSSKSHPDPIAMVGLLVHEAVHVFQEYCLAIGERMPSQEFEAYSIQIISQQLLWEYARRLEAGDGSDSGK